MVMSERFINWYSRDVHTRLHRHRRCLALAMYAGIAGVAYFLAFLLRFEFDWPARNTRLFLGSLLILIALRTALAVRFRLSTGQWRFVGTEDVVRLFTAATIGTGAFFLITRLIPDLRAVPRSVVAFEWVLTIFFTSAVWLGYRLAFERLRILRSDNGRGRRVLVVGAGEAGQMLVHEMRRFPTGFKPVGFVDDNPLKRGTRIHGVEVIGTTDDLPDAVQATRADELVIAIPSALPADLRRIVERCESTGLAFKLLPGIAEVLGGEAHLYHLREVRIEDLLGREPIKLELPELANDLANKTVLITGAAGSIGSELSRQIALHQPKRLVLLDQAETPLVYLDLDLRDKHPDLDIVPVVVDVTDRTGVNRTFEMYRPNRVFHAAAYKHVPMMELNAVEAVRNNVIGTWCIAEAAGRYNAGKFVLVSTDKAVQPVSVMGATKHLAELVTLEMQEVHSDTTYAVVRFGNVLGSNGSVIPIFRNQLRHGRPLTVTHPDVTRYFMTIPEAVQLVLQTSLVPAVRGQIAMLDMGEPVRIIDLAQDLLRLSGAPSKLGTDIVFTGLRPGEKLHEELVAPEETMADTNIPKVRLVVRRRTGRTLVLARVAAWRESLEEGIFETVVGGLHAMFPDLMLNAEEQNEVTTSIAG